jgi:DNA-binding transcriptional regulator GbsR (MarR family)
MSPSDDPLTRRFIEDAGNATQALGVGRCVGQIYAYLYFSEPPRTLDDMKEALGISKGSASMGVRQLEQWGAVQRIWVKGDRKDYYSANDYFGQIVKNVLSDMMGKRLESLSQSLDIADEELNGSNIAVAERASHIGAKAEEGSFASNQQPTTSNLPFLRGRVERLREFQTKVTKTWNNPIVKMMLK